ncbi:tyrosine-type recombinase/integrase [Entomobacter blattae]|uniref:tyrosine-type recombinase/integrase n=1 Tax=Entomobacter blattae TaxID=2762277 RepID=UPI001EF119DE|nr:site-specific integrase [Entomobacter blattae]
MSEPKYTLIKRGNRFYVRWWENGKAKRISLGTEDKTEARKLLKQFLAGIDSNTMPQTITVNNILQKYLENRKGKVSGFEGLKYACASISEHLGFLQPNHISRKTCLTYANQRREQGRRGATGGRNKPLSNGTIIKELTTLRAALNFAKIEKWLRDVPYIEIPPTPPPRDRWLTRSEVDILIEHAPSYHLKFFILLGIYTAARSGAILSLKWEQVDFKNKLINFGNGLGNKRRAIIPIPEKLIPYLTDAVNIRLSEFVIEFNGKPIKSIRHSFRDLSIKTGIKGATPHTLRHTAATWMVIAGVPFPMIAQYLGNSVEMIEKVYGHHSPEWLKQAAKALSDEY